MWCAQFTNGAGEDMRYLHVRRAGMPRGGHDLIIAAHALQTERMVLTFDAKARFGDLPGVSVIDA